MANLIFCRKGKYCVECGSDGNVRGFTVNNDPVIIRAANLPPTPLMVQVDKEYVAEGSVLGGDVTCLVICKPGCYRFEIPCDAYVGEAPSPGATELCYECDPAYGKLGALADAIAGGGDAPPVVVDVSAIVDKLCEIFGVPEEGAPTILDKLCEIATLLDVDGPLYTKLCDQLKCLETIKKQDASHYEEMIKFWTLALACFEKIKANTAAITGIETSLGQVGCVKDEDGNIIGSVLVCKVSDTTTSPPTDTIKVWLFGTDGSVVEDYDGPWEGCTSLTELADILTAILKCPKPFNMECVQKPVRCVGYDNGRTPGSSTNDGGLRGDFIRFSWAFTLKSWIVNGVERASGQAVGPYADWTAQLQGWADVMNAAMGDPAQTKCAAAFGFLPAPTWRYTKITCNDATSSFGPMILERDDGVCFTVYPILEEIGKELLQRYNVVDCDGVKTTVWCDLDGNTVEAPEDAECYISCAVELGSMVEGSVPDCGNPKIQKVCDKTKDGETEFYLMTYDCDGEEVIAYFTVESWDAGNPEEYEVQGVIVNCLTGEPLKKDGISWSLCYGYYVDAEGNNQETVWTIGVDACGNILFPNGSECPIYLQGGTGGDAELPQCSCTGSCSARALTGFGSLEYTTTGAGTTTHGIQFDATANAGLESVLTNTVGNANSSDWSICTVSPAPGVSFSYSQGTLVKNGPGDYTSTAPVPENNCQLELLSQEWGRHEDGTAEGNTGYSIRCCGTKANNCVVPGEGEPQQCLQILDPQPTNVIKGPLPEQSELLCLKEIKLQNTQVIDALLDSNEMASDALIKQCLLDDFWMNCVDVSEPIVPVPPINEEAVTTVTLAGDQTADYAVGSTVALYDAQGNIIGNGTVASAVVNEEGNTVVTLSNAEMTGEATTAQIATVKPVLQQTVGAVKAVVKNVSILQAKRSLVKTATEGKKETAEKG